MDGVEEIIIAIGTSVEAETTSLYLVNLLKSYNIKISRLSQGLPVGGHLEYIDLAKKCDAFYRGAHWAQMDIAALDEEGRPVGGALVTLYKNDEHSTRGLLKAVNQRKRLLEYLKRKNTDSYKNILTKLNLRK